MASDPSTPSVKPLRLDIPEQAIHQVSKFLDRITNSDIPDRLILALVWSVVQGTLSKYPEISGVIVNQEEFNDNVNRQGEKEFLELVRDSSRRRDLLHSDVFLKKTLAGPSSSQPIPVSEVSGKGATVRAWNTPFRGNAADVLLMTISTYLDRRRAAYARQTSIVNSSGTGKSRAVDQVARKVITVPMCLREDGSQGFPPSDAALRIWLTSFEDDQVTVARRLHGFIYSLLTVTCNYLEDIVLKWLGPIPLPTLSDRDIEDLSPAEKDEQALLVKERQRMLAVAFRDFMTTGQLFEVPNANRRRFFDKVIEIAAKFTRECVAVLRPDNGPPFYKHENEGVAEAGMKLSRFIDPKRLLYSRTGPQHPLVILSFDESHVLTDTPKNKTWTVFSELRRVLRELVHFPIFSLFLSTSGKVLSFSPVMQSDPSRRARESDISPLHPISEMSFDDLAYPAMEDHITLSRVVKTDWISHLGRPLFGSHYDAFAEHGRDDEIMHFAKMKLLNGPISLANKDQTGPGSLACLSVRFALEFDLADGDARGVARDHIERHMRLCVAVTTGLETLFTVAGSEPLLAEAASQLLDLTKKRPVRLLANNSGLNCIDRGLRGELVAALLIMQARDASSARSRSVFVTDFIKALLPDDGYKELQSSRPPHSQDLDDTRTFEEIFKGYAMWFNHVIRIRNSNMINVRSLWKFITRGAMVMCANNQRGVDIVLPICGPSGKLSRRNVTAILVQVKNDVTYKGFDKTLFDAMDPFRTGLFSDGDSALPVIRMVFALASDQHGVSFSPVPERRHHAGRFTAYDIWCAGLSEFTFKDIDEDVEPYRKLLTRSLQPRDAYGLDEMKDQYQDDLTINARGSLRRRMEPLADLRDEHNHSHVSAQVHPT